MTYICPARIDCFSIDHALCLILDRFLYGFCCILLAKNEPTKFLKRTKSQTDKGKWLRALRALHASFIWIHNGAMAVTDLLCKMKQKLNSDMLAEKNEIKFKKSVFYQSTDMYSRSVVLTHYNISARPRAHQLCLKWGRQPTPLRPFFSLWGVTLSCPYVTSV